MAIEITEELYRAALKEMCSREGHNISLNTAIRLDEKGTVGSPFDDTLPHLNCSRCGTVWLVSDIAYKDYDTAVESYIVRFKDDDALQSRVVEMQKARKNRLSNDAG